MIIDITSFNKVPDNIYEEKEISSNTKTVEFPNAFYSQKI